MACNSEIRTGGDTSISLDVIDILKELEEERQQYSEPCREQALLAEAEDRLSLYAQEKYKDKEDPYDF